MNKKFWAAALSAVLAAFSLSACTNKDESLPANDAADMNSSTDMISEEALSLSEEKTEADDDHTSLTAEKKTDGTITPPDDGFLKSIFNNGGQTIVFTLDKSGHYAASSEEVLYEYDEIKLMQDYITRVLSEEYYEENREYFEDELPTYEEYRAMMLEYLGDDIQDYLDYVPEESEPLVYFVIRAYDNTDDESGSEHYDEQAFLKAAERLFERIGKDPGIAEKIKGCFENGGNFYAMADAEYVGKDVIGLVTCFSDNLYDSFNNESEFYLEESISASGKDGFIIGSTLIPADTDKLFVSSRTESAVYMLASDFIPEDCLIVCADYDRYDNVKEVEFDFAQIAENLPGLKELYMYQAMGTNTEAIADMKDLESLSYYVSLDSEEPYAARSDMPFKDLPALKDLRLYGEYEDYSFLTEMPSLENVYVRISRETSLDKLFECPAVTSLEIEEYADLNGIEKLENLDSLIINFDDPDLAPVGKLKNLKYLEIYCNTKTENISELGNLAGLEELFLHSFENHDWTFLSKLKNVKKLNVMYVDDIYNDDIKQMPWLEELSMTEVMTTYSLIGDMPNLKSVHVNEILGSPDDFEGSDSLEYYSELFGRRGSYENLGKCPNLKNIILMGCNGTIDANDLTGLPLESISLDGTSIEDPLALGNIKTLKHIYITDSAGDKELIEKLSEMLPDCDINGGSDFFHNTLD